MGARSAGPRFRPDGLDQLTPSGPRARVDANLEALRLLRTLRSENRPVAEAELPVLAAWSSWGAVPGVFDETKPEWAAGFLLG